MKKSYNIRTFLGGAVTFLLVLVFAAPFYLLVVNSLKLPRRPTPPRLPCLPTSTGSPLPRCWRAPASTRTLWGLLSTAC